MKVEYKIEVFDIPNRVICKICDAERKCLNNVHMKSHGLTQKEYKKMFPNSYTHCSETRLKLSEKRTKWLTKNPGKFMPPHQNIRKYFTKDVIEKMHINNKLVQNLPHRKKILKEQLMKPWSKPDYRESVSKRVSKDSKKRWEKKSYRIKIKKKQAENRKKQLEYIIPIIKEMMQKKFTSKQIADKFNVNQVTIYRWLQDANVEYNFPKHDFSGKNNPMYGKNIRDKITGRFERYE